MRPQFSAILVVILLLTLSVSVLPSSSLRQTKSTTKCDIRECKLPNCLCMDTIPPQNLLPQDIPQLVFLTFDDAINTLNYINYTSITKNRINPNGCPISMTFYINHEYNDYSLAHNLFYQGHELGSHSVTHVPDQGYWANASAETMKKEIDEMRYMLGKYALVPEEQIKGYRAPFLQTSGADTYSTLHQLGMYDHSWPTRKYTNPPIWPYTLDYGSEQDCDIPPCVNDGENSFPGTWVVPMVDFTDKTGNICAMADACAQSNASETMELLRNNFERHYKSNKAPFGIYFHAAWFQANPYILTGYIQFLNYLSTLQDVYIVSVAKGLEWIKSPGTLSQAPSQFDCPPMMAPTPCVNNTCSYNLTTDSEPSAGERFMTSCVLDCPEVYPWLGDPDGESKDPTAYYAN